MTKNGVATAESGTQIKAMLNELSASGTKVSDTLKDISGKSFAELQAEGKNTAKILGMLNDHAEESGVKLSDLFGSVEAGAAAVTLVKDGGVDFCNVLEQMGNAAGATEKAYERLMANTTEERFNKLRSSLMLYVSDVGEKMLPAIEDFFDYLEEHSEEIEQIITGVGDVLSGLLKIIIGAAEIAWKYRDAILAVVATMAAYKAAMAISNVVNSPKTALGAATIAQKNFNTAVSANPIGIFAAGIAMIITYIMSFVDKLKEASRVSAEYAQSLKDISDQGNNLEAETRAELDMFSTKVERYEELRTAAELTAGQEEGLKNLAEELQGVFGDNVAVIDETTGAYNDLSSALDEYMKKQLAAAEAEAAKNTLTSLYALQQEYAQKSAAIEADWTDSEYAVAEELRKTPELLRYGGVAALNLNVGDANGQKISEINDWIQYQDALPDLEGQIQNAEKSWKELTAAQYENTKATDDNTKSTEDLATAYDDLESALTDIKTKYDLLNSAQDEFSNTGALSVSTLKSIISTYPELQDQVEKYLAGLIDERELQEAMTEAYDVDQQNYYKSAILIMSSLKRHPLLSLPPPTVT